MYIYSIRLAWISWAWLSEISQTNIGRNKCIRNYTYMGLWDAITRVFPNFNDILTKPPSILRHRWVISSHGTLWDVMIIHMSISVYLSCSGHKNSCLHFTRIFHHINSQMNNPQISIEILTEGSIHQSIPINVVMDGMVRITACRGNSCHSKLQLTLISQTNELRGRLKVYVPLLKGVSFWKIRIKI